MKRFLFATSSVLALTMAGPSFGADLPRPSYKAPAYVAPFTWSGFYAGVFAGYGFGSEADFGPATVDMEGFIGGLTVGYNLQTGVFVFGVELDGGYSLIDSDTGPGAFNVRNHYLVTAAGRIGYAFDRFLPFIKAGAAYGDLRVRTAGGAETEDSRLGYVLGGGLEYAFSGGWSAKIEYNYVSISGFEVPAAGDTDFTANIVKLGLNYRF